jgi:hypothetical protein
MMRGGNRPTRERPADIVKNMDWWRKEARDLTTSKRAMEIRAGTLIVRLLDAIERDA